MKDKIFRILGLAIVVYLGYMLFYMAIIIAKCDFDRDCIEKTVDPYVFTLLVMVLAFTFAAIVAYSKPLYKVIKDFIING